MKFTSALVASGLLNGLATARVLLTPTELVEKRAASGSIPINYSFGVTIPTAVKPTSPPAIVVNGYQFVFPVDAVSGQMVSFLGNFAGSNGYNTQITAINSSAPASVQTSSTSTSIKGGNSQSNATVMSGEARIVTTTFSSGNASTAAAGGQDSNTSTSTSSSGNSNSTAIATANALGEVTILTNATVAGASNAQSIQNAKAASAATSCAASAPGANSDAQAITTVLIPVGQPSQNTSVVSTAYAACSAGVAAPSTGSSSSGSQASLTGVSSTVTCNGITSTHQQTDTIFRISIDGVYNVKTGFTGAITGQRVAESISAC